MTAETAPVPGDPPVTELVTRAKTARMLREWPGGVICGAGDDFTMKIHNDEKGDYEMANHIVEYEADRRIDWEPVLKAASRPRRPGRYRRPQCAPLDL